ncbi:carboxypeptidase-like regulatory domain-containing protein [Haloglycomyces albus]|uniref:carboxypeptidase-like regulatory domain-containing protein n=1 Tax=Haloglycomyces albus TaxID=526067 RepID=UPI00046C99F7|nr:carboxypeptidase-like regulatory domain-containing protein [Haloglycomyces albus]
MKHRIALVIGATAAIITLAAGSWYVSQNEVLDSSDDPSPTKDAVTQDEAVVEGTVLDEDGQPIEGATVSRTPAEGETGDSSEEVIATDAQGHFTWTVSPSTYVFTVTMPDGSNRATETVTATRGETTSIDITLDG